MQQKYKSSPTYEAPGHILLAGILHSLSQGPSSKLRMLVLATVLPLLSLLLPYLYCPTLSAFHIP